MALPLMGDCKQWQSGILSIKEKREGGNEQKQKQTTGLKEPEKVILEDKHI